MILTNDIEFYYTLDNVDVNHSKSVSLNATDHSDFFDKVIKIDPLQFEQYLIKYVEENDHYSTFDDDEVITIDAIKVDGKYIKGSYELD